MPALAQSGGGQAAVVRRIDVGVSGRATYDSNIARSGGTLSDLRRLAPDDVRFTPALTIDAVIPIGAQSLTLQGSAGYDFYARNTRLNSERIGLDAVAGVRVGPCDTTLTASYARRQSDLGDFFLIDPIIVDPGAPVTGRVLRARNVEDIKSIGASAACGDAVGLRPTASIDQVWVDNSSDFLSFSDYNQTTVSAGLAYSRPRLGTVTVFGRYSRAEYPNRSELLGLTDDDGFSTYGGGVRFERQIGSRLRGLAELSYSATDTSREGVENYSGLTYRAQLSADVNDRLQATVDVSRAVTPNNRIGATYSINQSYGATVSYAVGPRLLVNGFVSYRDQDYRGSVLLGGLGITNDSGVTIGAGARYRLNRRINLTADVSRDMRDANGDFFDYNSNRVSVGFTAAF